MPRAATTLTTASLRFAGRVALGLALLVAPVVQASDYSYGGGGYSRGSYGGGSSYGRSGGGYATGSSGYSYSRSGGGSSRGYSYSGGGRSYSSSRGYSGGGKSYSYSGGSKGGSYGHGGGYHGGKGGGHHHESGTKTASSGPRLYRHTYSNRYSHGGSSFGWLRVSGGENRYHGYDGPNTSISRPHRGDWNAKLAAQRRWDQMQYKKYQTADNARAKCGFTDSPAYCYRLLGPSSGERQPEKDIVRY